MLLDTSDPETKALWQTAQRTAAEVAAWPAWKFEETNSMKIGIVGSEAIKFTPETEAKARTIIRQLLAQDGVTHVVSGGCHLGGIDIWAEEEAAALFLDAIVHKPKTLQWATGYAPRNRAIARDSDEAHCITVATLPEAYNGMRFPMCYHCGTNEHVKSGGCWTMKQAIKMGKPGKLWVIE
jgi:hypothetical protein